MTTADATESRTIRDFLFDGSGLPTTANEFLNLSETLRSQIAGLDTNTVDAAVSEVAKIGSDLMDLDVTTVLLEALTTYRELKEAGQRTFANSGSEELINLVTHDVLLDHRPSIDVIVDGIHLATVHLALGLVLHIKALTATVRDGRLVRMRTDAVGCEAHVSIEGNPIASRQGHIRSPAWAGLDLDIKLTETAASIS